MIILHDDGVYVLQGKKWIEKEIYEKKYGREEKIIMRKRAKKGTISYGILQKHNMGTDKNALRLRFDAMASHDITYVGIIQTAKASGMESFPVPYVLTNCHNSLCAVGGTINEDDHVFGLSAAKKYGGIFVPPHIAVIHQYMRERMAGCGKMILGSDSHTRYGALGTMAIGEGGGELVKQLLLDTYDIAYPEVIGVYVTGKPSPEVGPHDIALAIIGAVFKKGYVKNKVMEFIGPGIQYMNTDFRNSIDVMTTETACLTSIWQTDEDTEEYLALHGRKEAYVKLEPREIAYYDGFIEIDLSTIKPMIALPMHPSNVYTIDEFIQHASDILRTVEKEIEERIGINVDYSLTDKLKNGRFYVQQGVIAGCAGGNYGNIVAATHVLKDANCGNDLFSLEVYPSSQPVYMDLIRNGCVSSLMAAGSVVKTAFCGPCFGAGDTPANNAFSIRHTTRNFPNREGSKPGNGQFSAVALMDARSIAATARNGGFLTSAEGYFDDYVETSYAYDNTSYEKRVYEGFGKKKIESPLIYGPNIKDWPILPPLSEHLVLNVCAKIMDAVTTTDELIPSGETSSYRSNPLGLAEFTLSRREPLYVSRAKAVAALEKTRRQENEMLAYTDSTLIEIGKKINTIEGKANWNNTSIASLIYCVKPGDGSAREQAASCQRVLGGGANICQEYATKRYRSNVINWGMLPLQMKDIPMFDVGDYIFIPYIRQYVMEGRRECKAYVLGEQIYEITLYMETLTDMERDIICDGCLINFNKKRKLNIE
ncbi:hydratase [uncultured Megasphaera sp.]|uniref:hydratase n=1 Tax=uncultured Megasphaera sp. TaxID=165188 RepID=UPI002597A222|nr:hydratase [uncultured Megasphaera sp.]